MNNKPYRPCAGIVLINSKKKIFAGKRLGKFTQSWQMPQGGIDDNETALEAAKRELFEETNITSVKLLKETKNWLKYDIPAKYIPKFWNGKYQGQKQKWFLMEFTGQDSEINIATKQPEFSTWKWSSAKEILDNIVDFKKEIYQSVFNEFGFTELPQN